MRGTIIAAICMLLFSTALIAADDQALPYLRQPAISADGATIAFVYAGDIYIVPAKGGTARLLVSHDAYDSYPRFSPDGHWLAFSSTRTGGNDVYIIGLESGELRRLTWNSATDLAEGWSPDSKWVYFSSSRHDIMGSADIYKVSIDGGEPMPVSRDRYEEEYNAAVSPDGKTLAFNSNDGVRQWWRKGPVTNDATDIWLKSNDPAATDYKQFTTFSGMDSWPMWAPDGAGLYFISDEGDVRQENIWYQSLSGERRKLTSFTTGRAIWPDIAGKEGSIVFERDFGIWLLKPGGEAQPVKIAVVADERVTPIENKRFSSEVTEFALSPDNKKVAFIVHGEVFAAPASWDEDDPTPPAFRVTSTPARESGLAWSSDSTKLVYSSDRSGNPDLYIYDFTNAQEKRLTTTEEQEYSPVVSPDGKWCAYYRGMDEIHLINMADLSDRLFAEGFFLNEQLYGSPLMVWSPDSKWLAYFNMDNNYFYNIAAKNIEKDTEVPLTFLPNITGFSPWWSMDGNFIVFTTNQDRSENQIMRVDLRPIEAKFAEDKFDELFKTPEAEKPEAKAGSETKAEEKKKEVTVEIITDRIKDRIRRLVPFTTNSRVAGLTPDGKKLLFTNYVSGKWTLWITGADPDGPSDSLRATPLLDSSQGFGNLQFEKSGEKVWLLDGDSIKTVTLKGGAVKPYSLRADMDIDFHKEKLQVFREAWLMLRDHFYDPTFNHQDWPSVYDRYLPYIKGARSNFDLSNLINLMLGDLNTSHMGCYYFDFYSTAAGDLGITFDPREYLDSGRFKVEDVVAGGPVADEKSDLGVGSYLISIDGEKLSRISNISALLDRKVGKRVKLEYSASPDGKDSKTVSVKPVYGYQISRLLYRRWVRDNEAYVSKISGGRLGYVHIPDMGGGSLEQFKLDLDSQIHDKDGVVIDVRYNTGGYVAPFVIDVLQRRTGLFNTFRSRSRTSATNYAGDRILDKPTVVVQNEQSLSNAEMFAELYRKAGLGKIVGTESNGWVIWTWGTELLNGGYLRLPRVAVLTLEGEDLDNVARKPDVFVDRPIGQSLTGKDDQLDAAVKVLLEQIDQNK
jgi:tricorn protease